MLSTISPPEWEQEFLANPSAGGADLGAVLMQKNKAMGYMKPIHLANQMMTAEEKKYIPLEEAICTLKFAMVCFHSYIFPRKFTIIS